MHGEDQGLRSLHLNYKQSLACGNCIYLSKGTNTVVTESNFFHELQQAPLKWVCSVVWTVKWKLTSNYQVNNTLWFTLNYNAHHYLPYDWICWRHHSSVIQNHLSETMKSRLTWPSLKKQPVKLKPKPAVYTKHTCRFNGHFPGEPGLDGCPADNKGCWSVFYIP